MIEIAGLTKRFGLDRPDAGAATVNGPRLTAREREVVEQAARGRSNLEIAGSLTVTEATVKTISGVS